MHSDNLAHFKAEGERGPDANVKLFGRVSAIAHDDYAQFLPASAWKVYTQIVTCAWKPEEHGKVQISQAQLKQKAGLDEKTIRKGLALLVRIGLLDVVGKSGQGRPKTYRWIPATELVTETRRQQLESFKLQFQVAGELLPDMPLYPTSKPQEAERPALHLHQGDFPGQDRENFPGEPGKLPGQDRENFPGEPGKLPGLDRENFPVPLIKREQRDQSSSRADAAAALNAQDQERKQEVQEALALFFGSELVASYIAKDWRQVEAVLRYAAWRMDPKRAKQKPLGNPSGSIRNMLDCPGAWSFRKNADGTWELPPDFRRGSTRAIDHEMNELRRLPEQAQAKIREAVRAAFRRQGNAVGDLPDDDPVFLRQCATHGLAWWKRQGGQADARPPPVA